MDLDARSDAWLRLSCAGLPVPALVQLLREFGSAEAIFSAPARERARVIGPAAAALASAPDPDRLAVARAWLAEPGHQIVPWDDPAYPAALLQIADPPPLLYAVGDIALLARPALAVVGSRNATPQGMQDAAAFCRVLAGAGLAIVSGLALGIDAAAHRGALEARGATIAVIGTGPDRVYPARNRDLAHEIAERGLIISEFVPGTPPLKGNFPRRNRVISGVARGVLVVEATLSSGSLITARMAGEQGRELFAIPGSIHSPFARGCHRLIREGAKLVETAEDVLEELALPGIVPGLASGARGGTSKEALTHDGSRDARTLLAALGHDLLDADTLGARTRLPSARVLALLTMLELDGRVSRVAGGRWQRIGT